MTDTATLQARLAELEAAKQKLLAGAQKISIAYGDTKVEYRAALMSDMKALDIEIFNLRAQLGLARRRSLRPRFG